MDFVPFKKISPEKLRKNLSIMEEGNKILKKWAVSLIGKRKLRIFRERLFKGEFKDQIPPEDYRKILLVGDIRVEMMQAFAPFISMRAKIWASRIEGDYTVLEDVYQEAHCAFENAIFGYLGQAKKAKFMTYCWHAIDHRLQREIENKRFQLVPPSADGARELVRRYERFQQDKGRHVTFDEYIVEMDLEEEDRKILSRAIVSVIPESEFMRQPESDRDTLDYTAYAVDYAEDSVEREVFLQELKRDLTKCVELAKLTDFQKDLLEAACNQSNQGWKAEIARKYGLTRTRAGQAYKQACEKVKMVYEQIKDR